MIKSGFEIAKIATTNCDLYKAYSEKVAMELLCSLSG